MIGLLIKSWFKRICKAITDLKNFNWQDCLSTVLKESIVTVITVVLTVVTMNLMGATA